MKKIPQAQVSVSENKAHFINLVYRFLQSPTPYLLIWGGDGTANLAINSLVKGKQYLTIGPKAIGFLRGGSGNGIQDSYEVPLSLKKQVQCYLDSMQKGFTQAVDILEVSWEDKRRFGQLFGVGIDAQILNSRNQKSSLLRPGKVVRPGLMNYITQAIKVIYTETQNRKSPLAIHLKEGKFAYKGTRTNAEFPFRDHRFSSEAAMIEVGTRPYYGAFFRICPDVVCNDGQMDAYFFNFQNKWAVLGNLYKLWNGWYSRVNQKWAKKKLPLIEHYKAREMVIKTKEELLFHIDGELYRGKGKISLRIRSEALTFLVPESFWQKFHTRD